MRLLAAICCCALFAILPRSIGVSAQERPLPEQESFLEQVRLHLQPDDARQNSYAYTATMRRTRFDGAGRPRPALITVTESYPGFGPGEPRWERTIEENGVRVSDAELRKKDAERQKKAEEYARRLQNQSERAKIARDRDKERAKLEEAIDDVFRVYTIALVGRDTVDGHDTIVCAFTPKARAAPRTREGKWLRAFEGRAWISETDYEIARLDVDAVQDISLGFGLVARIHKGAKLSFQRRKINGDEWLPAAAQYSLSARILLLKGLREEGTVEFSDYKKFSVDTVTTVSQPKGSR
jgi:hypothetical protein